MILLCWLAYTDRFTTHYDTLWSRNLIIVGHASYATFWMIYPVTRPDLLITSHLISYLARGLLAHRALNGSRSDPHFRLTGRPTANLP